jgi:hypothetical protein
VFGPVHRQISIAQELCRVLLVAPAHGYTDAGGDKELPPTEGEGFPQLPQDTLSYAAGASGIEILKQYDELVASEARHGVLGSEEDTYPLAHRL